MLIAAGRFRYFRTRLFEKNNAYLRLSLILYLGCTLILIVYSFTRCPFLAGTLFPASTKKIKLDPCPRTMAEGTYARSRFIKNLNTFDHITTSQIHNATERCLKAALEKLTTYIHSFHLCLHSHLLYYPSAQI